MDYYRPESLTEAVKCLESSEHSIRPFAGGTDLLVQMKSNINTPSALVDIKALDGMRDLTREGEGFRLGAAVTAYEVSHNKDIKSVWPGVAEAAALIGSVQVRSRATLVGNVCNASPAADSVPALIAARAKALVVSAGGERCVGVEDIAVGPGKTSLSPGELVTSLHLPPRELRSADAYLRFTPRTEMDIAVASAGVDLTLHEDGTIAAVRLVLGAVAPRALIVEVAESVLCGTRADASALAALGEACRAVARPLSDKRATADYRRHVVGVLAERAVRKAYTRAEGRL